jgi:hypothetical protein
MLMLMWQLVLTLVLLSKGRNGLGLIEGTFVMLLITQELPLAVTTKQLARLVYKAAKTTHTGI